MIRRLLFLTVLFIHCSDILAYYQKSQVHWPVPAFYCREQRDIQNNLIVVGTTTSSDDSGHAFVFVTQSEPRNAIIVRYAASSITNLDKTFNKIGFVIDTNAEVYNSLVSCPNGKIIVVGRTRDYNGIIACYTPSGQLDTSFNGVGFVVTTNTCLYDEIWIDQFSGNIVVAGLTNTAQPIVARYTLSGKLDTTFNDIGFLIGNSFKDLSTYSDSHQTLPQESDLYLWAIEQLYLSNLKNLRQARGVS